MLKGKSLDHESNQVIKTILHNSAVNLAQAARVPRF